MRNLRKYGIYDAGDIMVLCYGILMMSVFVLVIGLGVYSVIKGEVNDVKVETLNENLYGREI